MGKESLFQSFPRLRTWRYRDGGRVVDVFTATWQFTLCWSWRRRNRYGVLEPFYATLQRWPREPAVLDPGTFDNAVVGIGARGRDRV